MPYYAPEPQGFSTPLSIQHESRLHRLHRLDAICALHSCNSRNAAAQKLDAFNPVASVRVSPVHAPSVPTRRSAPRPGRAARYPALLALAAIPLTGCTLFDNGPLGTLAIRRQFQDTINTADPLTPEVDQGLAALSDWQAIPTLKTDRYLQFSSHNRRPNTALFEPGGKDFNNFIAQSGWQLTPLQTVLDGPDKDNGALGGYVLASVDDGPGFVSRIFLTRFKLTDILAARRFFEQPDLGKFDGESLRIFVDDLTRPVIDIPLAALGEDAPFARPMAGRTVAAAVSYTPISFRRRLRVVLSRTDPTCAYFYHINVRRIDAPTRAFSPRVADDAAYRAAEIMLTRSGESSDNSAAGKADPFQDVQIPAGAEAVAFSRLSGGTITRLRIRCDAESRARLADVDLRIYYEKADQPAFDVPLDAFCAVRERLAPLHTLALRVRPADGGVTAEFSLPMPFSESIRIALRNRHTQPVNLQFAARVDSALPAAPWGYLHARAFAVAGPQPEGSRFEVLSVAGRGRYVGTVLFVAAHGDPRMGLFRAPLNILEGNERGVIDGVPAILGTGTEDYFNGGFYFASGPFDSPFAAANCVEGGLSNDPGVVSCCRWHVLTDAIDFQQSFSLQFQYGVDNPAMVERYATVAYYYLNRPDPGQVSGGS